MKLLMIAPEEIPLPPKSGGSVEHCMLEIAKRLKAEHDVTIISRRAKGYPVVSRKNGLTIERVPGGSMSTYIKHVLKAIKGRDYDWIQVDNRPRFLDAVRRQFPHTKLSLFLHSTTFITTPKLSAGEANRLLAKADLIVANSRSLRDKLAAVFPAVRSNMRFIHLGVDRRQFTPISTSRRNKLRRQYKVDKGYNVLYAGRLTRSKGAGVLLEAVRRLQRKEKDVRLVVAGGVGPKAYIRSLRVRAKKAGIRSRFLGKVPRARMKEAYALADCFVCPSQGLEGFGLVNVEAMACGVPVIASRNGGIREIIQHGKNGLLVTNYHDPSAFASMIGRLKNDPKLAQRLKMRGEVTVTSRFGWKRTAARLARHYLGN